MSTLLSAQSLTIEQPSNTLFEAISFTLQQGNKIGLIGHNGCGKSSLLSALSGKNDTHTGTITQARRCVVASVEQTLPQDIQHASLLNALAEKLTNVDEVWRVEAMLAEFGFVPSQWQQAASSLSGGQHMKLLLARALIQEPDLLLLDEPSNHLDLPTSLWLEQFLKQWRGSFVLVSHDQTLLDNVTNTTWIMRDKTLHCFDLPCSKARAALAEKDIADEARHKAEQKEIDRIEKSAKRLAIWGKVYDNEDLARKAKTMEKRKERLVEQQTELTQGSPWTLYLSGESMPANRLLELENTQVRAQPELAVLFDVMHQQVKSGDKVAILGRNGSGKSSLMRMLWQSHLLNSDEHLLSSEGITIHNRARVGYYDQSLEQLDGNASLLDALYPYGNLPEETRKRSLISAGFPFQRHHQKVGELSGGERSRLLFIGLTLANYHLLMLDEPTNHLDLEGKEELFDTLQKFEGGALVVSHDRQLIETACNRFWLVDDGKLESFLDVNLAYQKLAESELVSDRRETVVEASIESKGGHETDEEQLLEKLFELETLLEDDLARKPKHQKPKLQSQWREEIALINSKLNL
ncbi:ABC-F family ATP-binding cassette domain-containing protein [Vibrio nigripulchritudo]|uniref:ABC-F family ATP-binding cassette domain-containing protein n=1 Tax=Vibrio nigripulchritudo TaxID=28173 RepID=UPI0003B1F1D9|nr:ABC-F family ATP-binding cassette domain-containing protein [Vibrio nigripulchritudo]CCN68456.1 putative ATPase component of ABC transporter with duplicated ATPase domains [Vibrio nigripulchritudo SFn118]